MSQQSGNQFSKLVSNPSSVPDPNKISLQQFEKYHSLQHKKLDSLIKTFKHSRMFFGGMLALFAVGAIIGEKNARQELFGSDNKGGSYLNLTTIRDEDHYAYNRQFQRMFHLAETMVPDVSSTSDKLLNDLGVDFPKSGATGIHKKAAHEKYY